MKKIELEACAKINLHLDVVSRAENGYHGVNTVMQSVSLCDSVSVALTENGEISVRCDLPSVPCDRKNLAYRAAEMFFERVGASCGVDIDIVKRIPMAAGLAGGSTDAAAVFYGLNRLLGEPLPKEALCELGARLGADVPFCIVGGTKFADGFGERLHSFPNMPNCFIVVACAGEGVSTPWAYAALDEKYGGFAGGNYIPRSTDCLVSALKSRDIRTTAASVYNIFEDVISAERPMVNVIKGCLDSDGALSSMMSGSGPSVFGIFDNENAARLAVANLEKIGVSAYVCEPTCERF